MCDGERVSHSINLPISASRSTDESAIVYQNMDAAGPFLPRREVQRRRTGAITHVYKPGKSPVSPQKEEEGKP